VARYGPVRKMDATMHLELFLIPAPYSIAIKNPDLEKPPVQYERIQTAIIQRQKSKK